MTTIPGAQSIFLRAFRKSPAGPPPDAWPTPPILRRWLRRPAFRTALNSLREVLRFQLDFDLANAAAQAARKLSAPALDPTLAPVDLRRLSEILRLAHLRERFQNAGEDQPNLDSPTKFAQRDEIRQLESDLEELRQELEDEAHEHDHDDADDDDDDDADDDESDELWRQADLSAEQDMLRRLQQLKSLASPQPNRLNTDAPTDAASRGDFAPDPGPRRA